MRFKTSFPLLPGARAWVRAFGKVRAMTVVQVSPTRVLVRFRTPSQDPRSIAHERWVGHRACQCHAPSPGLGLACARPVGHEGPHWVRGLAGQLVEWPEWKDPDPAQVG